MPWHDIIQVTSHELFHGNNYNNLQKRVLSLLVLAGHSQDQSGQLNTNFEVQNRMLSFKPNVWSANHFQIKARPAGFMKWASSFQLL